MSVLGTRTHNSYRAMIARCYDVKNERYLSYGGRGISVCDRWRQGFAHFLADMGERPEGKTLDRVDNDGNYEPGNCRWATPREQALNQRPHLNANAKKTHCPAGHPYSGANLVRRPDARGKGGGRRCRTCEREQSLADGPGEYVCRKCGRTFSSPLGLGQHIRHAIAAQRDGSPLPCRPVEGVAAWTERELEERSRQRRAASSKALAERARLSRSPRPAPPPRPRGEASPTSKITDVEREVIRNVAALKVFPQTQIARWFGVSHQLVSLLHKRAA